MARKKKIVEGIATKLPLAIKTGKYTLGYKSALLSLLNQTAKILVIASNFPSTKRRLLEYYAMLADNTPICIYDGNNNELAKTCDKGFRIGVVSVLDVGEADMLLAMD
ncbi:ribosomal protein L30 [Hamiltosporidium tvaerminnensis]|uniref:Ribosomal protein L30 n=2 Tax=Hamiltosporidium TaxID=1176354 RepID=A0A4Q9LL03_9MICR|nr:60S ribosomal protein L30 [Hamiltosporidium tvaerminnensis]TBU05679.1 ribosomal protein L30 [Hamiltosporidium magnivora]TBT99217.1 ribosomal protein L30 [Hamiltosporidium tvaerminnensis]TBU08904.1 ribosomal protein L30 [Hamiltosporidium magnivora]TBU11135.1 ribosomal protein L30 [Hamiltosporidium tvaerminnensis]